MKGYVDGYVLPLPTRNLALYKKMAAQAGRIWMKHGALRYVECISDDLKSVEKWGGVSFAKLAKAARNDKVVFAFVIYKSKAHRDKVNAKVMKDPSMNDPKNKDKPMPFEMKRMAYGGFSTIVDYES
jgi:alkaline phosphatase